MTRARAPIDWADRSDLLEALRGVGDPPADDAVAAFDRAHDEVGREQLGRAAVAEPTLDVPPSWPGWADRNRVRSGQQFFLDHQWSLHLAFLMGSLPLSYCGASGALVLARTGHLVRTPRRRVFETAALMAELTQVGELEPDGRAHRMLRHLRIVHAAVRRSVEVHGFDDRVPDEDVPWDRSVHGRPINQLELLGTLWTFALTSLHVLDRSGVRVPAAERAAWLDLWNVVGHVLGIGGREVAEAAGCPELEHLLPMGEEEAEACFAAIQAREFRASDEGRLLMANLRGVVRELMPGDAVDDVVDGFFRLYLGDPWADHLGVPAARPNRLFGPMRWLWRHPGGWGGWLRRPVRRKVNGLHRALLEHLVERIADDEVHSLRSDGADRLLVEHLERLRAGASTGWREVPYPSARRRFSQR